MAARLRRPRLVVLVILVALALILTLLGVVTVRRSFPQVSGSLRLPGLEHPVEVYRDSLGVPQIYAQSEHDLFMAQGFVHAQDRFWQMDFWRHIGSGRLAEMFGEGQVKKDQFLRTMGWARVAAQEWAGADASTRAVLQAYADGVNAYLGGRRGAGLSLEYAILGLLSPDYRPESWTPINTLTWAKVMAWDLGGNMDSEIDRAILLKTLSPDQVAALYPPYPADHPVIVPGTGPAASAATTYAGSLPDLEPLFRTVQQVNALTGGGLEGLGSNDWVIGGSRTTTGMPLLANDMHLGIQMPSIWYEVGLRCRPVSDACRFNVTGFSFAGAPGVIVGHNDSIAWGVTNTGPDVQDLYIEKVNPQNPNQYEVNGKWVDMQVVDETIRIAGGKSVPITIRYTRHGPVLSDVDEDLSGLGKNGGVPLPSPYAVSLRWTALEPGGIFRAVIGVDLARNWDEFRGALRDWTVPSQNFVFADTRGNIGYQMPGDVPIRASGDGRLPVLGWTDDFEWKGYIPFDQLPSTLNPDQGFVATANNAVVGKGYAYLISKDWDAGFRAERIVQMIQARPKLSIRDVQAIHGDDYNAMGPVLVPALKAVSFSDPHLSDRLRLFDGWDFQNGIDSSPAALFNSFWRHLAVRIFNRLPEGHRPEQDRAFVIVTQLVTQPDSQWWDDPSTPSVEKRDDTLRLAFADAVTEMETTYGKDATKWRWGVMHTATFRNQTLGKSGIAPIEALFNRGPFEVAGGSAIVNATGWDYEKGYEVQSLPSERMIVDLSNLENSLMITTTGESGHAFHPNYIDMADLWRSIDYRPMLWGEAQIQAAATDHLTLSP
ncbi:MAG: penicillin acylase family protein [Actinobacteria bacterium]|nr:penicillin acylase family protein [Actinomycetota bacterium]